MAKRKSKTTNLNVNEYLIFRLSTEIDTHEYRWYYGMFNEIFRQNESHDFNIVYKSDLNSSATCDSRSISPGTSFFSTNRTYLHDIAKILLKVALHIITLMWTLSIRER